MCNHEKLNYNREQDNVVCLDCGYVWKNSIIPNYPDIPNVKPFKIDDNEWKKCNNVPCMFDSLPDGVYGLVCTCPKCRPIC